MPSILTIKGNAATAATGTVLSTLMGVEEQALNSEELESLNFPRNSVLIIIEKQIKHLATMRLGDFSGAVLVLSSEPFATLKRKYSILRSAQGSHDACQSPWNLPDLLTKAAELVPLEPENLRMLQNKLKIPADWLQKELMPHIEQLSQPNCNLPKELEALAKVVREMRRLTPDICHYNIKIGHRGTKQVQQHFQELLAEMQNSQSCNQQQIAELQQVCEKWCNFVLRTGEGLGSFS